MTPGAVTGRFFVRTGGDQMIRDDLEFEQIHADFRPKIQRYLIRLVGEQEAEDLTQEVFVKVSRALKNFRGESQLSTWLYRIATNTALDRIDSPSYQRAIQAQPSPRELSHRAPPQRHGRIYQQRGRRNSGRESGCGQNPIAPRPGDAAQ